jgi:hypothetical protein
MECASTGVVAGLVSSAGSPRSYKLAFFFFFYQCLSPLGVSSMGVGPTSSVLLGSPKRHFHDDIFAAAWAMDS